MIVLLLTTKNEANVLRLNLEHHLSWGVDHVAVCDNESEDDTPDVVRAFGDAASTLVFHDFAERQRHRMECLEAVRAKHGTIDWVGVSDTDEFHWAPDTTLPELLATAPPEVVAVTFHQKLFLPTEDDAAEGPVYARQLYRTGSYDSPLHRSYREGKTFYRGAWLTSITSEHVCHEVPHAPFSPPEPVVHHYMIRDEDQFVMKVRRLTAWRQRKGLRSKLWYHKLRKLLRLPPETPFVAAFKEEWWRALRDGGEAGLREYYRTRYRIQSADLPRRVAAGDLVRDDAFANWRTSTPTAGSD